MPTLAWWLVGGGAALLLGGLLLWALSASLERRARERAVQPSRRGGPGGGDWRVLPGRPAGFDEPAPNATTVTFGGGVDPGPASGLPPLGAAPAPSSLPALTPAPAPALAPAPAVEEPAPAPEAVEPAPVDEPEPAAEPVPVDVEPVEVEPEAVEPEPVEEPETAPVVDLRDEQPAHVRSLADLPPPAAGVHPSADAPAAPVRGRRNMVMLTGLGEPVVVESFFGAENTPGWYVDPAGSGRLRWWDGKRWTEHLE